MLEDAASTRWVQLSMMLLSAPMVAFTLLVSPPWSVLEHAGAVDHPGVEAVNPADDGGTSSDRAAEVRSLFTTRNSVGESQNHIMLVAVGSHASQIPRFLDHIPSDWWGLRRMLSLPRAREGHHH